MSQLDENNPDLEYQRYSTNGWLKFGYDHKLHEWVNLSLPSARVAVADVQNEHWWRYQKTWFAGVNVLLNDGCGMVEGGIPLQGCAAQFIKNQLGADINALDRAQVSVCLPGYPKERAGESAAATRYRYNRDAAHIDGLLREGEPQQRYVREPHDYILAIAMSTFSADASPFVVWDESHHLIRDAFQNFFDERDPQRWSDSAITECYTQVRKRIFSECQRIEIGLKPGEAILVHRLMLHGTAPWKDVATAGPDGRMICFFRSASLSIEQWLDETIY